MSDRANLMLVWPVAGFFVAIAFGVGLISMAAFGAGPDNAPPASSSGPPQVLEVELGDLFIEPATLEANAGALTINVSNEGQTEHNFAIAGVGATEMIPPGASETLEVASIEDGRYNVICEVLGHADGGMKGVLVVAGEAGSDTRAETTTHGMAHMSAKQMMAHDAKVTGSYPAETKGAGGVPLKQSLDNGVKVFELTADEIRWETEPGKVVEAWAYNGMVPGPAIKANLGDRVRIVLHNKLAEPTTIHYHGMSVPANMDGVPVISQKAVLPGERFTYEFTIKNSGSNMYHSHFNAATQVPMGLLGAFIVPDPEDPPADVDTTIVLNDGPLGFTLNGKGFPATAPIVLNRGQTVRVRYMNEGLLIHPMHLHGMAQKVIAKDGHLLSSPYLADTVLVGPGERYDVLVKATEPGAWAFHCHVLNHVEGPQGMFGMVTAVIVE